MKQFLINLVNRYCTADRHWILFLVLFFFGIAGIVLGICTLTLHNVIFGFCMIIFGRVYLEADVEIENPLKK